MEKKDWWNNLLDWILGEEFVCEICEHIKRVKSDDLGKCMERLPLLECPPRIHQFPYAGKYRAGMPCPKPHNRPHTTLTYMGNHGPCGGTLKRRE